MRSKREIVKVSNKMFKAKFSFVNKSIFEPIKIVISDN